MSGDWTPSSDHQLNLLVDAGVRSTSRISRSHPATGKGSRDRVTVDLRGLGPRLRAYAGSQRITPVAVVRKAICQLLNDGGGEKGSDGSTFAAECAEATGKVTLRMQLAQVRALAASARAADVSQGAFVAALLQGSPPTPLAADHIRAVEVLGRSTDRLAAMSADLNAFMRMLALGQSSDLERYRAGVMSLTADVQSHLACAAVLIAELRPARRPRR